MMTLPSTDNKFYEAYEAFVSDYPVLAPRFHRMAGESLHDWARRLPDNVERFRFTSELVSDACPCGGHVVDIGAWPGYLSTCMRRMGHRVTAVDKAVQRPVKWTPADLAFAEWLPPSDCGLSFAELCAREGIGVVNLDIESEPLPFSSGSADVVTMTEVIEHLWRDPLFALSEINRILVPASGLLILSTPNFSSLAHRLAFVAGHIESVLEHPFLAFLKQTRLGHCGHLRLYAPTELRDLLMLLGFDPEIRFQSIQPSPDTDEQRTPPRRRHVPRLRRFRKSPRAYVRAAIATAMEKAEARAPQLRGQMYAIARKVATPDFQANHAAGIKQLIQRNYLGSDAR